MTVRRNNLAALKDVIAFINDYLHVSEISDYSYNGLQVEGRDEISKIVTGVTGNIDLFGKAEKAGADLVLVHHGLYWKGGDPRLTGILGSRVRALNGMSLAAYHFPLDLHPEIGNNALIIRAVGAEFVSYIKPGDPSSIAMIARFAEPVTVESLNASLTAFCEKKPLIMGPEDRLISTVAVCSGGGGFVLEQNLEGIDAVISGEVHEQHYHLAVEKNVTAFVCGHHATEICGIRELGRRVSEHFNISCEFINSYSPL